MTQLIKNKIIQHSAINEKIKKIAAYKEKSSRMHYAKLIKKIAAEINENGMQEILFRDIEYGMNRIYRACRNAA